MLAMGLEQRRQVKILESFPFLNGKEAQMHHQYKDKVFIIWNLGINQATRQMLTY